MVPMLLYFLKPCPYLPYMMTSSNGSIFRVTGPLCGEFTGPRWIPRTKASDAELWCFFDLRQNKRLSKQWWGWWFETTSSPLWRNCNDLMWFEWACETSPLVDDLSHDMRNLTTIIHNNPGTMYSFITFLLCVTKQWAPHLAKKKR